MCCTDCYGNSNRTRQLCMQTCLLAEVAGQDCFRESGEIVVEALFVYNLVSYHVGIDPHEVSNGDSTLSTVKRQGPAPPPQGWPSATPRRYEL